MNIKERYWMSAAIDGEGSIISNNRNRPSKRINFSIVIANNSRKFLEFAQKICEAGKIYETKGRRCLQLRIERSFDVNKILKEIQPYLIIKKEAAKKAIQIIEKQGKWHPPRKKGKFIKLELGKGHWFKSNLR